MINPILAILLLPTTVVWTPTQNSTWQWQLNGTLNTSIVADTYDTDGFDTTTTQVTKLHSLDRKVICYISAGSYENWRPDKTTFPNPVLGLSNGWSGEQWLDIRQTDILIPIMTKRMQMCKDKGFDAIEADNVDGYSNSTGFPLTNNDQILYNKTLAATAHNLGMSIALKNDIEQIPELEPHFDFAINESCLQYKECSAYSPFLAKGKAVLHTEYKGTLENICKAVPKGFSTIKKRLSLGSWRQGCP
jgi:hypothetical protein